MSRTSRLRRTTLNTATLQEVALHRVGWSATGAVANPYLPWDTPKAIKDAMVLYYDIAKQKATNESMAKNPTLKDLSGNGNDATCYNFGWSRMSGIGGYTLANLEKWIKNTNVQRDIITPNKIKITKGSSGTNGIRTSYSANINIKFRFTEILTPVSIYQNQANSANTLIQTINEAGEYVINLEYNPDVSFNQVLISGLCTVEQLPFYPNALVSDGVDDYAFVQDKYDNEGNLINKKSLVLNREGGYTVIAKRKWLDENLTCGLISKLDDENNTNGAFGFELSNVNYTKFIINWGSPNYITLEKNDITYGTSTKYNSININSDDNQIETDYISLFKYAEDKRLKFYGQFALYSIILFDRDLTDEEIQSNCYDTR